MKNAILILDFGSQYTQLIARRVREMGVYSEIAPFHIGLERIRELQPGAIILSGGPSSVYDKHAPRIDPGVLELGVPVLGICYGLQLIAHLCGMKVQRASRREYGLANLEVRYDSGLLAGVRQNSRVWMSHGDHINRFSDDFTVTAATANSRVAAMESPARRLYGVQFHPEVVHSEDGKVVLANFVFRIAGLHADWNMKDFIERSVQAVRAQVGREKILLGLSGGVDSTTLALLLHRAVGEQLVPVFIDTGLLRKNEFSDMMHKFKQELHLDVVGIEAGEEFLKNLRLVSNPERKRKIIGKTFIDVFRTIEQKVGKIQFFSQGTLYPDVIESLSVKGPSATIKSHHNVGGLPEEMHWTLIEPFRELFKDEVREIGRELGLDESFIRRHPFPGPGLAVRILGSVSRSRIRKLQEADAILIEELKKAGIYNDIWQAFAVLLPVKSVGVMGDERTYENAVVLRMVTSVDGMTADWYEAPPEVLRRISSRIVNEVKGINRVTYDLTSKPPGTIEWE